MSIEFGTDGWRAIIAWDFTFSNVQKVTLAIAKYIKANYYQGGQKPPVLIGYDTRFLADEFALFAARVLKSEGIEVKISIEDLPTPAVAYAACTTETAGALQFTASHNPPEYCGIKYIPSYGGPATTSITKEIVSYMDEISDKELIYSTDEIPKFDIRKQYLQALKKMVNADLIQKHNFNIGYDALFSTSRIFLSEILADLNIKADTLHKMRDPLFGGGMPEPKPQYLKELMQLVKDKKLDLGIATDGDADRFAIIDENGNFLTPNQVLCLLAYHLVKHRKLSGSIVRTVATTHLLDRLAKHFNLDIIETPVGFKYVGEAMRHGNVLIGGEESGGLSVKGHIPEKDGLLADLLIIELVACENRPLSKIWQELLGDLGLELFQAREDFKLNNMSPKTIMEKLKENPPKTIGDLTVSKVSDKDGLKFYMGEHSWLLVRPSGTEPLLRLYSESDDKESLRNIISSFSPIVTEIMNNLKILSAKK